MPTTPRREFLQQSLAAATVWSLLPNSLQAESHRDVSLKLSSFTVDVTPPKGHSLCGGWITPVLDVTDSLQAHGIVLQGAGKPMVMVALDWTALSNGGHLLWRERIASAVDTTPERVAIHCVHQHNAPFACLEAQAIVDAQGDLPHIVMEDYFHDCSQRTAKAARLSMSNAQPVTHIGKGEAKVEKVASNRRIYRDENGVIKAMRGSSCKDPKLRAMTEGTIDPMLKTISFFNQNQRVAAIHYYATHPMSFYGDGLVSSDFVGIARKQLQQEQKDCHHIYFTGAAGNVSAGKYNDGSKPVRAVLAQRILQGMKASLENTSVSPIRTVSWSNVAILPEVRSTFNKEELNKIISNKDGSVVSRNRPSYMLAWLNRVERKQPIILSSLGINDIATLHLPAESFIEYQLRAQKLAPAKFVATAAYGDGGPWYLPVKEEYPAKGYEVRVAFCEPSVDDVMTTGIKQLLDS